ncbi:MAG TPA: hypothetical protein ENO20_12620 [Bacteroides sp.]|nr:hypothetical protein [Bacteroides sp.]
MNIKLILLALLTTGSLSAYNQSTQTKSLHDATNDHPVTGNWVRIGHSGPIGLNLKNNGMAEADFGNDGSIDVITAYALNGDTIKFTDQEGQMCPGEGLYKVHHTDYYLTFDLLEDDCAGRINQTMGFWTRPDFENLIAILEKEISTSPEPGSYLNRARIYMALGQPEQAKADFDVYLRHDPFNAGVYVNRAGTRFPGDLEGVVSDCNKAISIDPNHKNAYFLRGMARYELGDKESGCEDFSRAIALGFSVLRIAEKEKCASFWDME